MLKKFLLLNIIFYLISIQAFALDKIGNVIEDAEYPNSESVLPKDNGGSEYIISGSVEKNIDLTLENCIELAL